MKRLFLIVACLLVALIPFVGDAAYDSTFQKGYNFPSWWHDSYLQSWATESLAQIPDHGTTWIGVVPFWYQKDRGSSRIAPHKNRTASDASVEHIIKRTHERGFKVMLKPIVDPENGKWRGEFHPGDTNQWFADYTTMAVHYATMAERLGVASFEFGSEYETMTVSKYDQQWRSVIAAIRSVYKGQVGYGANWGKKGKSEFEKIAWWDAVDFIGIHAYFPLSTTNAATLQDMIAGWTSIVFEKSVQHWVDQIAAVQSLYGKPVLFTEAGYMSCDGGTRIPWWCNPNASVDLQEQSDGAESLLRVWQDTPWLQGIYWWMWNIKPWKGEPTDKGHDMNKKPVRDVIARYWTGAGSAPPDTSEPPDDAAPADPVRETASSDAAPVDLVPIPPIFERDLLPPPSPTHMAARTEGEAVELIWSDPEDTDASAFVIYRNNGGSTPIDGGNIFARVDRGVQRFVDHAVTKGVEYQYVIRAEDRVGNTDANVTIVRATVPRVTLASLFSAPMTPGGVLPQPAPTQPVAAAQPISESVQPKPFAYGKPRLPTWKEGDAAWKLRQELERIFQGPIPIASKYWPQYVNASVYGGYPTDVIVYAIPRGGAGVHPSIPWSAWQRKK